MAQNNTIHNILEVVVGTADIRSSRKDLRHLRNLRDKEQNMFACKHANMQTYRHRKPWLRFQYCLVFFLCGFLLDFKQCTFIHLLQLITCHT